MERTENVEKHPPTTVSKNLNGKSRFTLDLRGKGKSGA